jgi:hypothetical protein
MLFLNSSNFQQSTRPKMATSMFNLSTSSFPQSVPNGKDDAAVELMISIYWFVDVSGSAIGLIGNALLILACLKTSGKQLQSYSYLFLITAIYDVFYSVIELITQHVSFLVEEIW